MLNMLVAWSVGNELGGHLQVYRFGV